MLFYRENFSRKWPHSTGILSFLHPHTFCREFLRHFTQIHSQIRGFTLSGSHKKFQHNTYYLQCNRHIIKKQDMLSDLNSQIQATQVTHTML